jgi:hypothetical protein
MSSVSRVRSINDIKYKKVEDMGGTGGFHPTFLIFNFSNESRASLSLPILSFYFLSKI